MSECANGRAVSDDIYEMLASDDPPRPYDVANLLSATAEYIERLTDALFAAFEMMDLGAITPAMADLIFECCDRGVGPMAASVDEVMTE